MKPIMNYIMKETKKNRASTILKHVSVAKCTKCHDNRYLGGNGKRSNLHLLYRIRNIRPTTFYCMA